MSWCNVHKWIVRYGDNVKPDFSELESYLEVDDIETLTTNGNSIFHFAAIGESSEILKYLCREKGAVSMINATNVKGESPLHWAITAGYFENVKVLLQYGAKVNLKDYSGNTSLHFAAEVGNNQVIKLLLQNDWCDVKKTNVRGETALAVACEEEEHEAITILIQNGGLTSEVYRNYQRSIVSKTIADALRGKKVSSCK